VTRKSDDRATHSQLNTTIDVTSTCILVQQQQLLLLLLLDYYYYYYKDSVYDVVAWFRKTQVFLKTPNPLVFWVLLGFGLYLFFSDFSFERAVGKVVG